MFLSLKSSSINERIEDSVYVFLLPPEALGVERSIEYNASLYQDLASGGNNVTRTPDADIRKVTLTYASEGKESQSTEFLTTQPGDPLRVCAIGRTSSPSDNFFTSTKFQGVEALVCVFPSHILFVPISRSVPGAVVLKTGDDGLRSSVASGSVLFARGPVGKRVNCVRLNDDNTQASVCLTFHESTL